MEHRHDQAVRMVDLRSNLGHSRRRAPIRIEPEEALGWIAFLCGVFLLFGPLGGRTMWVHRSASYTVDAMIYNMAALFSGVVALAALAFAYWTRPRLVLPLLGLIVALAAFALSVLASGVYVWARMQGEVWFYGTGGFAGPTGKNETLYYAPGPPFFALAALIGAIATLGLAVVWLRQRRDARPDPGDSAPTARSALAR